jgi:pimeloyl-ACP methyl ester carboxylesterase
MSTALQKETLVLLPGMMCDERLFSPQLNAFSDRYFIMTPSLNEASSIDDMAAQCLDQLPDSPVSLAGLSMGGIVAMQMAIMAPEKIKRLALLDTNCKADAPERFEIRNVQMEKVKAGKLREVIIDEMKPNYVAAANRNDQVLLDLLVEMALDVGPDAFINQSLALRDRSDLSKQIATIKIPTLVMCGAEDRLCPISFHKEIASLIADADLQIIDNAGHITTLENPDAVNIALGNWLSTQSNN